MKQFLLSVLIVIGLGATSVQAQAPANDVITGAIDITTSTTFTNVAFDQATGASGGQTSDGCPLDLFPHLYYKHTAAVDGTLRAEIVGGTANPALIIFGTSPTANATMDSQVTVDANTGGCTYSANKVITTTAGQTYYVYVANDVAADLIFTVGVAPPSNDVITGAIDVPATTTFTNVQFSASTGASGGGFGGCDIGGGLSRLYYKHTATADGTLNVSIATPSTGTNIPLIYTSSAGPNATMDDQLTLSTQDVCLTGTNSTININTGTTYYMVLGNSNLDSDVTITIDATPLATPANDDIANATEILTSNFTDSAVNFQVANWDAGGQASCDTDGFGTVYYRFTAQAAGSVTGTITTPFRGAFVNFYEAPTIPVSDADLGAFVNTVNTCGFGFDTDTASVTPGTTYYVLVHNQATSDFTFTADPGILSIEDASLTPASFYPNPVEDELTIEGRDLAYVTVLNLAGQTMNVNVAYDSTEAKLDFSQMSSGMYLVQATNTLGQTITKRIAKR